jgi:nicotinamide-nucleotide amidase
MVDIHATMVIMIGILATGDELTTGEILNTNGKYIAQTLFDHNIIPGMQLTIRDNQEELEEGMRYLLEHHDALITIGGLGPTSDDRTRFALAKVLDTELIFDEASWQQIQDRLIGLSLEIPESNRQQCLFPKDAQILPNKNGTANSCYILHDNKPIFMLPGPPRECRPLLEKYLLPKLAERGLIEQQFKAHWTLMGVGEGQLAEQLDKAAKQLKVQVGYRATMPYIELKLFSSNKENFAKAKAVFEKAIEPYVVSTTRETARDLLYSMIKELKKPITIIDNATHGYLSTQLLTPDTYKKVTFPEHPMANTGLTIIVNGLLRYWKQLNSNLFVLDILILEPMKPARSMQIKVPNRGQRSLEYATEYLCWKIYRFLKSQAK